MSKLVTTTLVSLALAAAAPLATAQATSAPEASQQRHAQDKREFRMPSERVEARLTQAKTSLKITTEQEAQWNAFADVARKHAKAADERVKTMRDQRGQQLNAVERLERRQQMAAAASQRLTEILAVAKPLYASFSAEQKTIADKMLTPHGGRGHHGPRPA